MKTTIDTKVTAEQLLHIMPNAKDKVGAYINYINGYSDTFKVNTPMRMAHFLAQIAYESNELRHTVEIGTRDYFRKYDEGKLKNTLGNIQAGDGYKYRGRGLIQITGRANYEAYQRSCYCRGDIMTNPSLLEKPLGATKSAMWWWMSHGLNEKADKDYVVAITQTINGGTSGLKQRRKYLQRAKEALGV